jgi:protein O-mannosyl-transferase
MFHDSLNCTGRIQSTVAKVNKKQVLFSFYNADRFCYLPSDLIEVKMINKDNGFDLNIRWPFPGGREYTFAFIALLTILIIIYANSFQGTWQFDDHVNIVENKNIFLKTLDWSDINKTFYGVQGHKLDRPLSYFSFALNYYVGGLNPFGYHIVNFVIHYLTSVFLFLFIYHTLKLPILRERYGPASYSIALLASVLWATSPLQVTAVTYIVQRMASMTGLFYIMAMYFYLKGRTTDHRWKTCLFWGLCILSSILSLAAKENAIMLPISIWIYDLLLIQGGTFENIKKNLKVLVPVILIIGALCLWYVDISSIFNGNGYKNRPFTLMQRLLTEPRVIFFYITLLIYPISSRLTLIHDIDLSTSLLTPWSTLPAIFLIFMLLFLAGYIARKRPLIAFCIFFYFINHFVESSFLALELIYEHRNYIPSMFFFVPLAIVMLHAIDYFSYKKAIQFTIVAVFAVLLSAQVHTVFAWNTLFTHPLLLWTDNVKKTPTLSRPYNNLGATYWDLGCYDKSYELNAKAMVLDRQTNVMNRGVTLYNLGMYYLNVTGEYDKALNLFQSAIKAYPGYWPPYNDAAVCFIQKGNLAEAGHRLVKALSIWPENAHLRHTLGFVLLKMGEYDEAVKQSRRALSFDPDLYNSVSVLGEAYRRKGDYILATFYWKEYLKKYPTDLGANLALVELYARQKKKDDLSRVIGKLIFLKGSKNWCELMDLLVKGKKPAAYIPDYDDIISIITTYFNDQRCQTKR